MLTQCFRAAACTAVVWMMLVGAVGAADEAAHGHTPHLGMHGANTQPEEFKSDLAIYTFVVFLVLLLILRVFAWKPITKALDERERRIADDIAAAMRGHEDAKKLLAQYEARLAAAQDEVRAIIEEGRKNASHLHDEILAKAREDAVAEMNRAKRDVETARDQALQQLAETSANLAVELAGKIVRVKLDAKEHGALIDEAVHRIAPSVSRN